MKNILMLLLIFVMGVSLVGCATQAPQLKAPCDQFATFCGSKTKINQW